MITPDDRNDTQPLNLLIEEHLLTWENGLNLLLSEKVGYKQFAHQIDWESKCQNVTSGYLWIVGL